LVNIPKSVIKSISDTTREAAAIYVKDYFDFALLFENRFIRRLEFSLGDKFYTLKIDSFQNSKYWDILCTSVNDVTGLVYSYLAGMPYRLQMSDPRNKVGVTLYARRRLPSFETLQGFKLIAKNQPRSDDSYKLVYTKKIN
jgi:hypothetical protein